MQFKQSSQSSIGSENFLKLNDHDSITGVFRGDLFEYQKHWIGSGKTGKSEECTGPECIFCKHPDEKVKKTSFGFRINFVTKRNQVMTAIVWDKGWTVYKALRALNSDYPLESHLVKITRSGSQMNDTTYSILPLPNSLLTPEQEKSVSQVQLHDLRNLPKEEQEPGQDTNLGEDDIPF